MALRKSVIHGHGSSLCWLRLDPWKSGLDPVGSVLDPLVQMRQKFQTSARKRISGEYFFNKHFTVFASINNLANAHYFTRRADSYPGPGIVPADARSFYVTVQYKL